MPRFCANLSHLFTEVDLLDRPARAAACGFDAVEMMFPYDTPSADLRAAATTAGLEWVLINSPRGDADRGDVGVAAVPGEQALFKKGLEQALGYADGLGARQIHVLAGLVPEERWPEALDVYIENLSWAADVAAKQSVTLLIEPIALEGYFLTRPDDAVSVIEAVDHPNLRLMYDIYQAQLTQGAVTDFLEAHLDLIPHIQVAGVPGRNEPDGLGELNWPYLFGLLDAHGYTGWVGAEYDPRGRTEDGLAWGKPWGLGPSD